MNALGPATRHGESHVKLTILLGEQPITVYLTRPEAESLRAQLDYALGEGQAQIPPPTEIEYYTPEQQRQMDPSLGPPPAGAS